MKKLLILLFSILISFNSYGETRYVYFTNGEVRSEANFKNGKREGLSKTYYENGAYKYIDTYKNGKKIQMLLHI